MARISACLRKRATIVASIAAVGAARIQPLGSGQWSSANTRNVLIKELASQGHCLDETSVADRIGLRLSDSALDLSDERRTNTACESAHRQ
jgi:hypothetical protein